MNGLGGKLRARTKEELWSKFQDVIECLSVNRIGVCTDAPLDQKRAFEQMCWDEKSQQWVLDFYFARKAAAA